MCRIDRHNDATEAELASREINSGMYIFDTKELREALDLIQPNNAQGEYYLPDKMCIRDRYRSDDHTSSPKYAT